MLSMDVTYYRLKPVTKPYPVWSQKELVFRLWKELTLTNNIFHTRRSGLYVKSGLLPFLLFTFPEKIAF